MNALEGLNDEIQDLINSVHKTTINNIQNYLSNKDFPEKYISVLKSECNKMDPFVAFSYLSETVEKNRVSSNKKVKGILGLAKLLRVSGKTAQNLKNTGNIDGAIIYVKSKLYFDENEILKIYVPKILAWKSFKLRKDVSEDLINWYEKFSFL